MDIAIKIPDEAYELLKNKNVDWLGAEHILNAVANGTPLPKEHGRLKDIDEFLEKVKKDREHEIYMHSWTADMVLERLDSWYAPTIIEADKENKE